MPAIITHDTFGRQVYERLHSFIGDGREEFDAFLLGCQGPDVLFYGVANPLVASANLLGQRMHRELSNEVVTAFMRAARDVRADLQPIARAYVMGFLCHYELDSAAHPFIYAQQWAICDAGVPGLDRSAKHEVHAEIETELDELVLSTKRGETIGSFDPSEKVLRADRRVLDVISAMYVRVAREVFGVNVAPNMYRLCLKAFRVAQKVFWSPGGGKRAAVGAVERVFREHSFYQAMSHRNRKIFESAFDNREHNEWKHPDTGEVSNASFWDIYNTAAAQAETDLQTFFSTEEPPPVQAITNGRNFNGTPIYAQVISVE